MYLYLYLFDWPGQEFVYEIHYGCLGGFGHIAKDRVEFDVDNHFMYLSSGSKEKRREDS